MKKNIREIWECSPKEFVSDEEFSQFFNNAGTFVDITKMGFIDFTSRIFTSDFYKLIGDPRDKTSLEIGFGGGRLINAASRFFKKACGVDIHNNFERTKSILEKLGCNNYELLKSNQFDKIPDDTIDFVYSFIVFQHFTMWTDAVEYFEQIKRVLKSSGAGIIYFGLNENPDCNVEEIDEYDDEGRSLVNKPDSAGRSLLVKPEFASNEIRKYFDIFEIATSTKKPWNLDTGGQFYIKFTNKANYPHVNTWLDE